MARCLQLPAPDGAQILFDGTHLDRWCHPDGRAASWTCRGGALVVRPGRGDLITRQAFGECQLHLEFLCPPMPGAQGQDRANSGVFLQDRYELQILDSFGVADPGTGDGGAVYRRSAPLQTASLPPGQWQSLDVIFRAAEQDEPARLSVLFNALAIHNNLILERATPGALDTDLEQPGPLRLQDHGAPVEYRNIWLKPLPAPTSGHYQGERSGV